VVVALEHRGHGVSHVVEARAGQAFLFQEGDGFAQITAPVFAGGGRAAQLGDEAAEQVGNRCTCPGIGDGDPQTVDPVESKSPGRQGMVLGVNGQDGQPLAPTQTNAAIHHPDEAMTEGGRVQGAALKQASGIEADQRASRDPIADRLRTRGLRDATPLSEELEHTRHGTQADPYLSKEPESSPYQVDLVGHDTSLCLGFLLPYTLLGLSVGLVGAVSLVSDPCELFAQRAMVLGPLLACAFPWLAALSALRLWAHHVPSCHALSP